MNMRHLVNMRHLRISRRLGAFAAVAGIVLTACGDDDSGDATQADDDGAAATDAPAEDDDGDGEDGEGEGEDGGGEDGDMEMPPLPDWATEYTVELDSPSAGGTLTENEIEVQVEPVGYELACEEAGKPLREGVGHYHTVFDGALVDMSCDPSTTISMQNVEPGEHTVAVHAALNDHNEVLEHEQEFTFTYEPDDPLPEITDNDQGEPSITIVSPEDGATVSGEFDVEIEVENFELSCDLLGKPGLLGFGHWHINIDENDPTAPMMGMAPMVTMSCENSFTMSTEGLEPGSTHDIIALLADNGHAPLPGAEDSVEVTIE